MKKLLVLVALVSLAMPAVAFAQDGEPESPSAPDDAAQPAPADEPLPLEPPADSESAPQASAPIESEATTDASPVTATAPKAAVDGKEPSVGILVTNWVNVPETVASDISRELAAALTETLNVQARSGTATDIFLASQLPSNCLATTSCVRRLYDRVGTDELLLLTVVRIAQLIRIDISKVDPKAGTVQPVTVLSMESLVGQRGRFRAVASDVLPGAPKRPKPIAVSKQQNLVVKYVREPQGRHVTTGVWLFGSAAVVAGAGALITGLFANDLYGDLERAGCLRNPCRRVPELAEDLDSLRTLTITTDILIGVSVASALTAGILFWQSAEDGETSTSPTVTPTVGPNQAGVVFEGRF